MIDINNIKQLCRERGTTMTVIARRMYPTAKQPLSQLSTALRGNPRLDWIERLAKEIGCDTGALITMPKQNTIECPSCGRTITLKVE